MKGMLPVRVPLLNFSDVLSVAADVSAELDREGVPNAVSGSLAFVAHRWRRFGGKVEILAAGASARSFRRDGVVVRIIPSGSLTLDDAINAAKVDPELGVPIVSVEALVLVKLRANRMRDRADLVELWKDGALPARRVRRYLKRNAPRLLVERFDRLMLDARAEARRYGRR